MKEMFFHFLFFASSWCLWSSPAGVVAETLQEAIMKDMLPDGSSSCTPPAGKTSHTFTYQSSQEQCQWFEGYPGESEKYGAPWSNHEPYVFAAKMTHTDSRPDRRSWELRIGTGGNLYGFYGPAGEMIAPQKRVESPWIDDVWHSVGVDPTINPNSPYMIHGAGSYQSDFTYGSGDGITLQSRPFYVPNLGKYCNDADGECSFIGWAQHGPVPVKHKSPMININRYKNCGNGVIEHTMVHHNNIGSDVNLNRLDAPFGSIRMSTFRDMVLTNSNSEDLFKQEDLGRYDTEPERRSAKDTMGYAIFAEDLPSSNSGKPFPLKNGVSHRVTSGGCEAAPPLYPYFGIKCKIETTTEDTEGTRAAIAIEGTPSNDYFTKPCDEKRANYCVNQFKFIKFGTNNYCRAFGGSSITCRLDNTYLDNFANSNSDKSFVKFSATTGVGEFTSSAGIVFWAFPGGGGSNTQLIFNVIDDVDKSLSEIDALIASNPDAIWEFDYFNPPGAGGRVTAKNGIIHWAMKLRSNSYWLYFYPDQVEGVSDMESYVRNKFPPGSTLKMVYDYGKPESENLALAHVYGKEFSSSRGLTPGWPLLLVGQGNEGAKPRDANFLNIVTTANRNTHGGTHHYTQYFIVDSYSGIGTRSKSWVDKVIHDNYNVRLGDAGSPSGRQIDLYSDNNGAVGGTVGGASCAGASTKVCSGTTTPQADSKALVHIKCGNRNYIGSDLYHFAKDLGDGNLRPYICKNDKNARGVWTLLGFFPDNSCSSVSTDNYDETLCGDQTGAPTSPPNNTPAPTPLPNNSPTKAPTAPPTAPPTGECEEDSNAEYFHRKKGKTIITKTCGWLKKASKKVRTRACKKKSSSGSLKPAKEVCVKTCDTCDGGGSPTQSPTRGPTPSPNADCTDQVSFFWKAKGSNVELKECSWLSGLSSNKVKKLCAGRLSYGRKNGIVYGPPQEACAVTCDSCDACYENMKSKFFWKEKNGKSLIKNCAWLEKKNTAALENICTSGKTDGLYPTADEACPKVCGIDSC